MRNLSSTMKKKVASRIQTGENSMSASLWVGRPTTPLTDDNFLEKQTVLYSNNISKTSLAVCHPTLSRGATYIYFAYIESGEIKITRTHYTDIMERHEWEPVEFSEWAEDVALCFDGTMPKAPNGWVEFKTEQDPWIFWVLNGVLYGKKLSSSEDPIVLAVSNCTAVSAVRAMWSTSGGYDFGLVVFFLLDGVIYYRQLIGNEWMDAEIVSFGPDGVTWQDIAAFRTWDYRVGLQCKATNGSVYELFTQFMGVAKQNTEHVEIRSIDVKDGFKSVNYIGSKAQEEHVEMSFSASSKMTYGLSSIPLEVYNVDDGTGNYGTLINVKMDHPISNVEGSHSNFTLIDSNSVAYPCIAASVDASGTILQLTFSDFNLAEGAVLTLTYTPGSIQSPATALDAFSVEFTPTNLVAPDIPVPEPVNARVMNPEGTEIALEFSESITGDTVGNEDKFVVSFVEYEMVPGGTLVDADRLVLEILGYSSVNETLDLSSGESQGIAMTKDTISLEVS